MVMTRALASQVARTVGASAGVACVLSALGVAMAPTLAWAVGGLVLCAAGGLAGGLVGAACVNASSNVWPLVSMPRADSAAWARAVPWIALLWVLSVTDTVLRLAQGSAQGVLDAVTAGGAALPRACLYAHYQATKGMYMGLRPLGEGVAPPADDARSTGSPALRAAAPAPRADSPRAPLPKDAPHPADEALRTRRAVRRRAFGGAAQ